MRNPVCQFCGIPTARGSRSCKRCFGEVLSIARNHNVTMRVAKYTYRRRREFDRLKAAKKNSETTP